MRILGIDYGDRRIGLAVSDPLRLTAQPLETHLLAGPESDRAYFRDIVLRLEVETIVIGIPVRMDGSPGTRAEKTREFGRWLETAVERPVVFWDERLTTRQAQTVMRSQKVRTKDKKSVENQIAASIILAGYLESLREGAHGP